MKKNNGQLTMDVWINQMMNGQMYTLDKCYYNSLYKKNVLVNIVVKIANYLNVYDKPT